MLSIGPVLIVYNPTLVQNYPIKCEFYYYWEILCNINHLVELYTSKYYISYCTLSILVSLKPFCME